MRVSTSLVVMFVVTHHFCQPDVIAPGHVNRLVKISNIKARESPLSPVIMRQPFSDIPVDYWAVEDIVWVKARGLNYKSNPSTPVSRAEMAVILKNYPNTF
jgi:hypothetical protein